MPDPDLNAKLIDAGGKVDREALFSLYEQSEEASGDDETPVSVRFQLGRDLDKRLDKYLVDRVPFLSRTSLQQLIKEEAVTVNGRVPKASTRLHKGDVVVAMLPPPPSTEIQAQNIPLEVLYEDDDLIVINKADDIIVHPARGNKSGTIINALAWHFQHRSSGSLSKIGTEFARPGVVHRLDRHTTGVMVAAKSETAHWRLGKQFEARTTEKRYLAVVHGQLEPYADVIDLPLGKHPTIREKYAVRWDPT
ncbi:MAG: RluA family pseudouridine synthase, partial [Phycisphaerales bacterium]|nr:RluA family pseudouridine synthase [Phycisphaerales bacterium]